MVKEAPAPSLEEIKVSYEELADLERDFDDVEIEISELPSLPAMRCANRR